MTDSIFSSASVESISNTTPIECVIQHLKFVRRYTLSLIDDLDDEEWFDGMAGISVPIFNSKKELCFCLSTHTAKSRKDINDLKKILPKYFKSGKHRTCRELC